MSQERVILITVLVVFLVIAILFLFIGTIFHMYQNKADALLQQLEEMRTKYQMEVLRSQLEMKEQTLQDISHEVHDNIGQSLSTAILYLDTGDQPLDPSRKEDAVTLLVEALDDMRDMTKSWSLELIKSQGLPYAIQYLVDQLKRTRRFVVCYEVLGNYIYQEEQTEIFLFRILQEAINNIIRHSHADKVTITLDCSSPNAIAMVISDDGDGFEVAANYDIGAEYAAGGISHMVNRAKLIGGSLYIESTPGQGTTVSVNREIHYKLP